MSYPIEFCGNCGTGQASLYMNPCTCDYYSPGEEKRCNSWKPGHFIQTERVVYICSPCRPRFAGDMGREELQENLRNAEAYCLAAAHSHAIPIAPHLLFTRFLDEMTPSDRNLGREMGMELLKRCDEVWVFGERVTEGMWDEIAAAKRMGKPIVRVPQDKADEIAAEYKKGDQDNG